jgi:hypothetical protein
LIERAREAMLAAVQIYNNPLITFKTESFIVLSQIAWTYLLHAHYRAKRIDYRHYRKVKTRKRYARNPDGSIRHWALKECVSEAECPLDTNTKNNLVFLIGLRNQIEHRKAVGIDSYMSARYQACALNFNFYLKKLHGERYGLDNSLALSLQFAELDYQQSNTIKDKEQLIPPEISSFIAGFDAKLTNDEVSNERFAYRLLFTKITAKRQGQADRVIEFIDPKSEMAKNIAREYWVKEETEKLKLSATQVIKRVRSAGISRFTMHDHTVFWKEYDGKNPNKGFGTVVVKTWYWYEHWPVFVVNEITKRNQSLANKGTAISTDSVATITKK